MCFTDLSYSVGRHPPGKKLPNKDRNQVRHHGLLGHGLAVQAIRQHSRKTPRVGLAENAAICVPVIETSEHIEAARKAMRRQNAQFLTAVLEGCYMEEYLKQEGQDAPKVRKGDMDIIGSELDFVGLNAYSPTYVRAAENRQGFAVVPVPDSYPLMYLPWLAMGPEITYWGPRHLAEIWNVRDVRITENGCSSSDCQADDGQIYDMDRVMFLRQYLRSAQRAVREGYPLKGYFVWSLLDNFEWVFGYTKRFGIIYVNYTTQQRTPKMSGKFYREVIARNQVV